MKGKPKLSFSLADLPMEPPLPCPATAHISPLPRFCDADNTDDGLVQTLLPQVAGTSRSTHVGVLVALSHCLDHTHQNAF